MQHQHKLPLHALVGQLDRVSVTHCVPDVVKHHLGAHVNKRQLVPLVHVALHECTASLVLHKQMHSAHVRMTHIPLKRFEKLVQSLHIAALLVDGKLHPGPPQKPHVVNVLKLQFRCDERHIKCSRCCES
jgi:hypothetical protein